MHTLKQMSLLQGSCICIVHINNLKEQWVIVLLYLYAETVIMKVTHRLSVYNTQYLKVIE